MSSSTSLQIDDHQIHDLSIRLFTFLRDLAALRTKTIRTLDHYEKVLWFDEIPQETGCHCIAWHGAECYGYDMVARQRMLERCGWTFWRVRGSTFYRNPEATLEGLWSTLNQLGIHPTMIRTTPKSAGPSPLACEDDE